MREIERLSEDSLTKYPLNVGPDSYLVNIKQDCKAILHGRWGGYTLWIPIKKLLSSDKKLLYGSRIRGIMTIYTPQCPLRPNIHGIDIINTTTNEQNDVITIGNRIFRPLNITQCVEHEI